MKWHAAASGRHFFYGVTLALGRGHCECLLERIHEKTMERMHLFKDSGFRVVYIWGPDWKLARRGRMNRHAALCGRGERWRHEAYAVQHVESRLAA